MSTVAPLATVLRTEGLSVSYGGVRALVEVDIVVGQGQLVGLIGPNGAGKTTFVDAVTGFTGYRGRALLDGVDLSGLAPHERARRGLARTWQSSDLFDDLTVRENLAVVHRFSNFSQMLREIARRDDGGGPVVDRALEILGLDALSGKSPPELTQGQRKLVGVARAFAARPRLLCLDEPAAGLDTVESRALGLRFREMLEGSGASMLLIDHDMGLVLSVCDYVYVLDYGKVIARGTPDEVRNNPAVIQAYLGASTPQQVGALSGPVAETYDGNT